MSATVDRIVTIAAAVSAPVLAILTRHHVITSADAESVGVIIAAAIGAYHGGRVIERRSSAPAPVEAKPSEPQS